MDTAGAQPFIPTYKTCNQVSLICPLRATLYGYRPNYGSSIFFAIFFGIIMLFQISYSIATKRWSFMVWMGIGTILETVGYIGKLLMNKNPWDANAMQVQLVALILAPSFIAAAISVTFKHLIIYVGEQHSILKARWYPWVFIGTDFISIFIQAIGGIISAIATDGSSDNKSLLDVGNALLITGVAFQAANMAIGGCILLSVVWRYKRACKNPQEKVLDSQYDQDKQDPKLQRDLHIFSWALFVAFIAILARCCYRIPEMAGGWGGPLMQDEVTFLVLDGMFIAIAVLVMSIHHPGRYPRMTKSQRKETNEAVESS